MKDRAFYLLPVTDLPFLISAHLRNIDWLLIIAQGDSKYPRDALLRIIK